MQNNHRLTDRFLLILLLAILAGLPLALRAYDRAVRQRQIPGSAKVFTLTGHTQSGWILGDVRAYDMVRFAGQSPPVNKPVIRVRRGDRVVLRLKSSDVLHGFSLKDLGIYITEGIPPGKVRLVSFVAERQGVFTFSCNAICGANHEKMQGTLVVTA